MAKLRRVTNKLYASDIDLEDIGQFGSAIAGVKNNTKDIPTIQSGEAWSKGWSHATMSENNYPTRQERNGMDYSFSYQIDYLLREGIPEYDEGTEYSKGAIVKKITDNKISLFRSLIDNNIGFDLSSAIAWKEIELGSLGKYQLFDIVPKDHILSFENSKGYAPLGSYVYKQGVLGSRYGYPGFYDRCLQEYNEGTDVVKRGKRNFVTTGTVVVHGNEYEDGKVSASNFSTTNGILGKYSLDSDSYVNSVTTITFVAGASITTASTIFSCGRHNMVVQIISNKLYYYVSSNGTSWNLVSKKAGSTTLIENNTYTLSVEISGIGSLTSYVNGLLDYTYTSTSSTSLNRIPTYIGIYPNADVTVEEGITASYSYPCLTSIELDTLKVELSSPEGSQTFGMYERIPAKVNANKHVFYDIKDKNIVDTLYTSTGMAWMYGIDKENERILLPRNDWYFQNGSSSSVGSMQLEGLPNITGTISTVATPSSTYPLSGCFANLRKSTTQITNNGETDYVVDFDASRSSSAYGNSSHVQPNSVKLIPYMIVGNTEETQAITNVIDVTTSENDTLPLFTGQYFDFKPNNVSWLKADTVQPKSEKFYETAYNELVKCLNEVDNIYSIKVVDVADMVEGVDYSLYWKVDQVNMTFTTPSKWGLVSALTGTQRVLVAKKEPTTTDPTWYNWYSDGWCEQGGICNSQSYNNANQQVTFFIPYKDTSYTALTSAGPTTQGSWQIATRIAIKTTTGLDIRGGSNANAEYTGACAWQASGYTEIPNVEDYTEDVYLYFKVGNAVQNTEIIDVGALTEAVNNKIDINSKYVDGQWVSKTQTLSTATAVGEYTIDLSDYLPNDNYNYEVQLTTIISKNASNAGRITMYIETSLIGKAYLCCTGANCTPNVCLSNIPIGLDRKFNIKWTERSLGENNLMVVAYRRIGTNA